MYWNYVEPQVYDQRVKKHLSENTMQASQGEKLSRVTPNCKEENHSEDQSGEVLSVVP